MIMIERPDADALLAGPLGEWLSNQNAERAAVKAKVRRYRMLAIVGAVAVAVVVMLFTRGNVGTAAASRHTAGTGAHPI